MENLDIRGLNIDNIQLSTSDKSFGSSLRQLEVSNLTTCQCPQATRKMFGESIDDRTKCGLTNTIYSAVDMNYQTDFTVGFQSGDFDTAISSCEFLIEDSTLRVLLWVIAYRR